MSGRRLIVWFLACLAIFAAALVYFQFYAFYERTTEFNELMVEGRTITFSDYNGVYATSSPLKLRGCFTVDPAAFKGLAPALDATPLTPPPWFRCFDTEAIATDLAAGNATAYRLASDAPDGFDLMAAIYPDGRGFLWRQLGPEFAD